jgi:hypothetical protein
MKAYESPGFRKRVIYLLVSLFIASLLLIEVSDVQARSRIPAIIIGELKVTPNMGVAVNNIYVPNLVWDEGILYNILRTDGASLENDILKARIRVESGSGNNCGGILYLSSRNTIYKGYGNLYGEGNFDTSTFGGQVITIDTNNGWSDWLEVRQVGNTGIVIIEGAKTNCTGSDAVVSLEVFHTSQLKPPEMNAGESTTKPYKKQVMIFGPIDGSIPHQTSATWFEAGINLSDFLAGVNFINPSQDFWDYGMAFRGRDGRWLLLSVMADKGWILQCGVDGKMASVDSGVLENLKLGAGEKNYFELHVAGDRATFLMNRKEVGILDVSCASGPGDVSLSSGWMVTNDTGNETRFEEFVVYESGKSSCPSGIADDCDGDGLPQDEETWIANTFVPRYILDTDEPSFPPAFIFQEHLSIRYLLVSINQV